MKNRFLLHPSVKFTISEYRVLPLFDFEFTITSIKIFLSPLNINKKPAVLLPAFYCNHIYSFKNLYIG